MALDLGSRIMHQLQQGENNLGHLSFTFPYRLRIGPRTWTYRQTWAIQHNRLSLLARKVTCDSDSSTGWTFRVQEDDLDLVIEFQTKEFTCLESEFDTSFDASLGSSQN